MKNPGIDEQLKKMTERMERIYRRRVVEAAPGFVSDIMNVLTTDYEYHDVTGNATTGWYVSVYVRGELVFKMTSAEFLSSMPTRKTLRKGEAYDRKTYWGGAPVTGNPYIGKQGRSNYFAYKRANEFIKRHKVKYARKNRLVVLVGNATEYSAARYNSKIADKATDAIQYLSRQGFNKLAQAGELRF